MSLLERVRPSWSATGDTQEHTSAYLLGAFSGLRAAGISLGIVAVPLLAVWATAAQVTASWTQALRISASGWLLLQHVAIAYPGGHLGLAPLGLTLVPGLAIYRSARRLAAEPLLSQGFSSTDSNPRPAVEALTGLTVAYAGCAVLVAAASWSTAVISPTEDFSPNGGICGLPAVARCGRTADPSAALGMTKLSARDDKIRGMSPLRPRSARRFDFSLCALCSLW